MQNILTSWFVQGMVKATSDMWLKGWDERNGGNVSLRLLPEEVQDFASDFYAEPRCIELSKPAPALANDWFLVTASGKFFRNVQLDPADSLVLLQVDDQGLSYKIHWGLSNGGLPTSELAAHFQSHSVRKQVTQGSDRVIMHCHATHFMALSYVVNLDSARFTRLLWEGSTECLVVFPDGVGILPWMVPGTDGIGQATADEMAIHSLVMWPFHGIFGAGPNLDETFGLIDTAEKSSEVVVKALSMGGIRQSITTAQLIALGERFNVKPWQAALDAERSDVT
ncbi:rhamnulose-1-phosphate aldolase [Pantoea ananatis]|jgi:rhamnulose-1-phosphate aldolase|uniref:rhamnulose-1-phosphate aldolase n=1 Tax=Pantoea ananas TaxID=553 RepID=UPI000CF3F63C|nr:rhamnulose-1-phosphate aldolase [Pantoea ananatis]NQE80013.1 rhamnulose-1-phosphate aldolase [Pantoea ananatis]NQE84725.1 rhamnulose-1-phosphate aldolase [Pantoea ananatis]PQK79959.1 rhamnulose-1-phosphate aldolase [Pantoea ananatis]RAR73455.1 rhamnulose-1-phosphate aldolase [Pantoea ananatis]UEG19543.1 rhamnulose-1-phosphate aldolase [Pantoea ananatis]